MPKALVLVGSHLLCLVAGGYFLNAATASREGHDATLAATKSSNRDATATPGSTLAHEIVAASHAPLFDAEQASKAAAKFAKGEGQKRVRELTADGKKEPTDTAEFAAALLSWFREDPGAAIAFMQSAAGYLYDAVLVQALKEMPLADHLKLAKTLMEDPAIFRVGQVMGERLAALSPAEAAAFFKENGFAQHEALMGPMIMGWPADKISAFLDMAIALNDGNLIQAFIDSSDTRRQASLLVLMDSRNLDLATVFPQLARIPDELRGHLYRYADPSVPLDERIAQMRNLEWLKDATPEALREGALKQISTVDINELMKTGTDYRYAFRHGAMTADEVLAAVKQQFPELAATSEYETRVRVFNELASEDAQAAYALIADLPEQQLIDAILHQSRWSFRHNSPDAFYEMINLAPGPDSATAAPQRADAWNSYAPRAYGEYREAYVDWVRELPPGANRDAARASLAAVLKRSDHPERAKEFEAN